MERHSNILYRLARFLAGIPPDTATMILAVLKDPSMLADALVWALNAWAGELFVLYTVAFLVRCIWPLLPARIQRFLLKVRDFFWPRAESKDQNADQDQSREIADLKKRVRELERLQESSPAFHTDNSYDPTDKSSH